MLRALLMLYTDTLCRGGMALGFGAELFPREVVGGCVAKAVYFDKQGGWPKFAVHDQLLDALSQVQDRQVSSQAQALGLSMVNLIQERLYFDEKQAFLHFASSHTVSALRPTFGAAKWAEVLAWIRRNVEAGCDHPDPKTSKKYQWAANYLGSQEWLG